MMKREYVKSIFNLDFFFFLSKRVKNSFCGCDEERRVGLDGGVEKVNIFFMLFEKLLYVTKELGC